MSVSLARKSLQSQGFTMNMRSRRRRSLPPHHPLKKRKQRLYPGAPNSAMQDYLENGSYSAVVRALQKVCCPPTANYGYHYCLFGTPTAITAELL